MVVNNNFFFEFEVMFEVMYYGLWIEVFVMFVEIGSIEDYWRREDVVVIVVLVFMKGLGLDGDQVVGCWFEEIYVGEKVLLGIGGGYYVFCYIDIVQKDGVWVGYLLLGYFLLMFDLGVNVKDYDKIEGIWKEVILEVVLVMKWVFLGGEVVVYFDGKSFKVW